MIDARAVLRSEESVADLNSGIPPLNEDRSETAGSGGKKKKNALPPSAFEYFTPTRVHVRKM
jgi:hypothetical protein